MQTRMTELFNIKYPIMKLSKQIAQARTQWGRSAIGKLGEQIA
ncbi:MAG: hypothetical protein ABRQ24_04885 [Syntrophomonadaceae bacterium]